LPYKHQTFFQTTQLGPLMIFLEFGLIILTTSLLLGPPSRHYYHGQSASPSQLP